MPQEQSGGAVVVVPIVGQTKVLLIEELTKPKPRYWKFVSERFDSDDILLDALVRGVAQEAGLSDLRVQLDHENKHVRKIVDPRVLWYGELAAPERLINEHGPEPVHYRRYFWGIRTVDAVIESLSRKEYITKGERERIRTQSFYLGALNKLRFLPSHRTLVERLAEQPQIA